MTSHHPGPPLTVKQSSTDEYEEIKYKNPFTSHKTLGHLKPPGEENTSQKILLTKIPERCAVK
eukprot:13348308-Ditylum_brightwellii.AAC.1